ncbi:CvpA family protein [Chloroflexota bacterium]
MNWLDIVVIILIAVPTLIGLKAGLIKAVLSLAGLVVGVILAGVFYQALAAQLTFISSESIANIVAFTIILVAIMVVTSIIAGVLKWLVSLIMLGWVNKLGGAVFGFLMGAMFCGAILAAFTKYLGTGLLQSSAMAMILLDKFPIVLALLPSEFDVVRSFLQ